MIEWIKCSDKPMPKDREILAIWKGAIGIAEWSDSDEKWHFAYCPARMNLSETGFDEDACLKFRYWQELPEFPND
jgi:hypothetical protein